MLTNLSPSTARAIVERCSNPNNPNWYFRDIKMEKETPSEQNPYVIVKDE